VLRFFFLNSGLGISLPFCFQAKSKPPIITRSDTEVSAQLLSRGSCYCPTSRFCSLFLFSVHSKCQIICYFITFILLSKSKVYFL